MKRMTNDDSGAQRRSGTTYQITPEEIQQYKDQGYLILNGFLSENEMETLDPWFDHFVQGKEPNMGKDFCDMSQPYGTPFEEFRLVNAMLPSHYRKELVNNIYFQVAQSVADQLYEATPVMDYEQFLAKRPQKEAAEFAMHQDLGYWPKTANTWTATFSLALSDSDLQNGCLQVCPGTNKEPKLRNHVPKDFGDGHTEGDGNRDDSHTLVIEMLPDDEIVYLPVKRGSVTIHDERIVHGSGGNTSEEWRKTYVMAFRDSETVRQEREMGFTHSHNDDVNWEEILH